METQSAEMAAHLSLVQNRMGKYHHHDDGDNPAPRCMICERGLLSTKKAAKAKNFWNVAQHIQCKEHLEALPELLPKESDFERFTQHIQHPEGGIFFNHISLEVNVEHLTGQCAAPAIALPCLTAPP